MIDYSTWETRSVRVTNLNLDSENPRIPPTPTSQNQEQLIHLFCNQYRVYELAQSIVQDGYFPDEKIVLVEEE